ncbi:MAG TPA: type II secretion system protein [Candidatus Acidoferrum sp.]|nr:type II secretion system protein [Candidatus Acidoferrum sp.]
MLCVMAIIAILASLLLPAVFGAYNRIKGFAEEFEGDDVAHMLKEETRKYCAANPSYQFASKAELADKCILAPKPRNWVQAPSTDFVAFTYLDPTNKLVLSVYIGPKHRTVYRFTKADLSVEPQR